MKTSEIIAHLEQLDAEVHSQRSWNDARKMVIDYLKKYHGLEDQYQWAYLTIKLLNELRELKEGKS